MSLIPHVLRSSRTFIDQRETGEKRELRANAERCGIDPRRRVATE